ncbi:TM0106 family RecB-like putative nuclease [Hoyosella sp. YIM 151337]|uniref:TM0106 family RecB-like putative nuclease n=1 Tax=Hoyosella sp. YIM 151337 TaxID=2992742 RepID=UPI00223648AD|nr:bifunctional RecB family nuclease/DEAD/DEAH box helicase [Hoyosella sp. YIM 151337]MCW4352962.1 TM0106 family RecB-like putative nuclease [Hoyosella sp. YIM 151337]
MFLLPGDSRDVTTQPEIVYSATDLALAAVSEFDFLRSLDMALGRVSARGGEPDPLFARTAALGEAHERKMLDELTAQYGAAVAALARPVFAKAALTAAAADTIEAIRDEAPVIYQGTFFDGRFAGFCDFLIREDTPQGPAYAVYDTKLARHARVPALLQLAAYADQLLHAGMRVSPVMHLVLGDGTVTNHRLTDVLPVYRQRRARLDAILDVHLGEPGPVAWGDSRYTADVRSELAAADIARTRDVILVAGLTTVQRARLNRAGITTIDQLAGLSGHRKGIPGISPDALDRLCAQAAAQVEEERTGVPYFALHNASALRELPEPSAGDIFFDFEGDPLWAEDGSADWGLEYLFGIVEAPDAAIDHDSGVATRFRAFWAHDRAQEKRALRHFLDYVVERRDRYPEMHVYHYAPYEKTALRRLVGRHGVGEAELDTLLRANVFVDLYPLVRKSIRIGKPSYSIKKLEPLYMGAHLRGGDVTTAGDSIAEYARYCELVSDGGIDAANTVLASIEDYNRYDCDSTLHLRNWLARQARQHGVPLVPSAADAEELAADFDTSPLEESLLEVAGEAPRTHRSGEQQAAAMTAAAMNYHWREDKPFWWGHFDRLSASEADLAESSEALVFDSCEVLTEWTKGPKQRILRRYLRVSGEAPNGATLRDGGDAFALYDTPCPDSARQPVPGARGYRSVKILSAERCYELGLPVADDCFILEESCPKECEPYAAKPVALTPGAPPPAAVLKDAVERFAHSFATDWPKLPSTAAVDVLLRQPPRIQASSPAQGLTPVAHNDAAAAIITSVLDLDHSYLAVQGPPGTGKTYTGSRVISDLVLKHHWKVGVVAQSHSVVENMLDGIVEAGVSGERVFKPDNKLGSKQWTTLGNGKALAAALNSAASGAVIGGTAWTFANPNYVPEGALDLLVIDEAGQFCLANTLAVAGAARNLLLLGDPQQLPQVSQGTHPEPIDESALGWLIGDHGTIPPEYGYFLERTFRMHPELCRAVSALSYEGRLMSEEAVTRARSLEGVTPGVTTIMVDHRGNSTSSIEEAFTIRDEIAKLLGTPWQPQPDAAARPLGTRDIIVVAPYNAQVNTLRAVLRESGFGDVMAGTVDKFQGRQAAVAIVSMTASALEDVPRGMAFLLNRNRLNVAISRGQWLAVIVRSPALTDFMPATPEGLEELGAFLTVCEG